MKFQLTTLQIISTVAAVIIAFSSCFVESRNLNLNNAKNLEGSSSLQDISNSPYTPPLPALLEVPSRGLATESSLSDEQLDTDNDDEDDDDLRVAPRSGPLLTGNTNLPVVADSAILAQNYQPLPSASVDLKTSASHHHHGHGAKGWLDMGAWTGKKGAFGWYDKHPVGKGK